MTTGKTIALTRRTFVGKVMSLPFLFLLFVLFLNFYFYFILLYNTVLVLPYIDMNPPQVYMSSQTCTPLPPPTAYHLSGSSPCTSPKHLVSCIKHRLVIRFLYDSIHVSMPFSQIIPPAPSPTESKSLFFTSVSLLLSHIQGQCYHLGSVLSSKWISGPGCLLSAGPGPPPHYRAASQPSCFASSFQRKIFTLGEQRAKYFKKEYLLAKDDFISPKLSPYHPLLTHMDLHCDTD